jgi:hypothetical protein
MVLFRLVDVQNPPDQPEAISGELNKYKMKMCSAMT